MTKKKKILEKYSEKIENLINHNKLYYECDSPKITDLEYDNLKKEIYLLEKNFPFLKKKIL